MALNDMQGLSTGAQHTGIHAQEVGPTSVPCTSKVSKGTQNSCRRTRFSFRGSISPGSREPLAEKRCRPVNKACKMDPGQPRNPSLLATCPV